MIAGALATQDQINGASSAVHAEITHAFKQLCAADFTPLTSIPHDTKKIYQDKNIRLIQQSLTLTGSQDIAQCKRTGQVCISWSRLDHSDEKGESLNAEHTNKKNDASFILACYQRWQDECPKHIKGDFVFAVYDPKRQTILLVRDRLGVKPLYYNDSKPCFVFASNLAAIANLNSIKNYASIEWVTQFLFKHHSDESLTAFTNIKKLPAGHTLLLSTNNKHSKAQVKPYWQLEELLTNPINNTHSQNWVNTYRQLFDQAVRKRVNNDQTLGIELSGGLDSSSIMASLMEQLPNSNVHCFSRAYFSLEKKPLQALYKRYPNTINHLWDDPLNNQHNYQQDLNRYIALFGLPDEHSLAVGCSNFLKTANQNKVTTLLSGFGGDEFSSNMAKDTLRQLANQRRFIALYSRLTSNPVKRLLHILRLTLKQPASPLYQPVMLQTDHPAIVEMQQQQLDDYQRLNKEKNHNQRIIQRWRLGGVLRLESHSLAAAAEGTAFHWPFLDEELLACYFASPVTERFGTGGQKRWLHRRAFAKCLPNIIVEKNDKHIGSLVNSSDPHEVFMQRLPRKIKLHPQLQNLVDEVALNQFLATPTEAQKQSPNYRYTSKSIYSINLWLNTYF